MIEGKITTQTTLIGGRITTQITTIEGKTTPITMIEDKIIIQTATINSKTTEASKKQKGMEPIDAIIMEIQTTIDETTITEEFKRFTQNQRQEVTMKI